MADTATSQRIVAIDGTNLDRSIDSVLEQVVVVDRLAMPDTFTLVFRDPNRDVLGQAGIEIGNKVRISTGSTADDVPAVLIDGEVTSIETDYDAQGTRAVVRGYDLSHRLTAGRKTATFQNMSYSEIASKLAGAAGLTAEVDDSGTVQEHVLQANTSDLEFLYGLARRIGFECRVDADRLLFKRPPESATGPGSGDATTTQPTELFWRTNLFEFRARMTAVAQVGEVKVRGWNPDTKEAVVGKADPIATNAELALGPTDLAGRVGGGTMTIVDHPVATQQAADELARARAEQVGSAAFEATAVATGSPELKAGAVVSINGVDPALEGRWVVSGSRHELGRQSYLTHLEFTGRQDRSIHGLVGQGSTSAQRYFGVVNGVVTDNADPAAAGRVKVKYPWMADDAESFWARLMAPGAGKDYGVTWIPQVGDEVLVGFVHGDPSSPIVLGGLWNGVDTIPFDYGSDLDAGNVTYCGFTSRTGHKISFLESSGESKIHLLTADGKISIELDGKNETIKVDTTGKLVVDAEGDVEIKAGGSMTLEATGQMSIKGATVALN